MKQTRQPSETLQLIARVMAARFGQPHADAWLAEQLVRDSPKNLPDLGPASKIAPSTQKRDALRGRLRPFGDILRDNIPAKIAPIPVLRPASKPQDHRRIEAVPSRPTSPVPLSSAPLTAAAASRRLIAGVEAELRPTAFRIYAALHQVALEVAQARGYHPEVSCVTYHCPLEIVAVALDLHRTTIWRHLRELRRRGLIDTRSHKTTLRGEVVNSGTLWQLKLNPQRGKRPRLSYQELKHSWRDLEADVKAGRTAFRHMQQSSLRGKRPVNHQLLLTWALPPQNKSTPLPLTVAGSTRADLETVLDLPHAAKGARNAMVDTAAQAVCLALGDRSSLDFYRRLLWNLLRHHDQGSDHFGRVYTMLKRVQIDRKEGFARRAGALFIARLKQAGLWEALFETPPLRVGLAPSAAKGAAPIITA